MSLIKRFLGIIGAVLLSTMALFGQTAPDKEAFTLQECIEYGFKNSVSAKNAFIDVEISKAKVKEIRADGLPQINGSAGITDNFAIQTSFLPAIFFADDPINNPPPPDAKPVPVNFGVQYSANGTVTAQQLLFDGVFFLGLKAAKVYTELASQSYHKTKIDLSKAIHSAYYGALVSKEQYDLTVQNFNRLDTLLRQTTAQYENGFSEKIDVDRIRVTYNNTRAQLSSRERLYNLSLNLLKYQMGYDIAQPIELTEKLDDLAILNAEFDETGFDYTQRIEFTLLETQRTLDEMNMKQFQYMYYPKLYLNANGGANSGTNKYTDLGIPDNWFGFGSFGVSLTVPIFDGMRKRNQISQARLEMQKTENQLMDLENMINVEVVQTKINYQNSFDNFKLAEENMELAQEIFRVTKIKFQEGFGSSLEVVDAETSYKEAETNYFNAMYDALLDKVEYLASTGRLLEY
ncbi:TolC family protein [Flammeovirgaceae bacterium SG7u.111]|nr:TolC family protein [Flammeovirgaceae bacterium SG7u.132]WPO35838.1 TolC family protein [Flammeovirgaceae bacterium SG7u.111]